jgi:hypothetical protein
MNAIVQTMLVGLSRTGAATSASTADPGEAMVGAMGELPAEKGLLLHAAVDSLRTRAGVVPVRRTLQEQAPPETRSACSQRFAHLVVEVCEDRNKDVLGEALAVLDARGLRLPASVIPTVAQLPAPSLLPAAVNVCGERGRWLAAHNPDWRWLVDGVAPPSQAAQHRVWQEGLPDARIVALKSVRAEAPEVAHAWIEEVWKDEKAAFRESMIEALAIGLSAGDEGLLESARADRAASVRTAAVRLLARLPESAFAARARAHADAFVSFVPPTASSGGVFSSLRALVGGKPSTGTLTVTPPTAFDPTWAADAIGEKPPEGVGPKAFWLGQIVALVPPQHWSERFAVPAETLIEAAAKSEWAETMVQAWIEAATAFAARDWAIALWRVRAQGSEPMQRSTLAARLLPALEPSAAEEIAMSLVADGDPATFRSVLAVLPRPLGTRLGEALLASLERLFSRDLATMHWSEASAWSGVLSICSLALPPKLIRAALSLNTRTETTVGTVGKAFAEFRATLMKRQRIYEDLPS